MATKNTDWTVRGQVSPDLIDCAVLWDCVDISERTRNVPDRTFTYCGVGKNASLLAVTPGQRVPGTGTLVGPDEEVLDVIEEFFDTECQTSFALVHCDGEIRHYSGVYWGNVSSQNSLTAQGPDATAAVNIDNVSFQFDRITRIRKPTDVPLAQFISDQGFNEGAAVFGSVNGTNTTFRLQYIPASGYPITVYLDGVATAAYTIDGRNITFDTAPPCDTSITVDYYDERYQIYGLCPVAVAYCDSNCGTNCGKCENVYAIYESSVAADPDVCGTSEGNIMAVAQWEYSRGDLDLDSVTTYPTIVGPVDAVCATNGNIVVIAANGIFEGCSTGYSTVSGTNLPAGATYNAIAYDPETDHVYILYDGTGVIKRNKRGIWSTGLTAATLTATMQNDIDAYSGIVITVGSENTVQVSDDNGLTWNLKDGPDTAGTDLLSVGIGWTNDPNDDSALIGVLGSNVSDNQVSYWATADLSDSWSESRKTWNGIPVNRPELHMFEDWLVYAQIDDETWRNANRGCDKCGAWELLLDSGYLCSDLAVCDEDPNRMSIFSRPGQAAVPDSGNMSGTVATVEIFDVLANDYTETCAMGLDTGTLTVVSFDFDSTTGTAVAADVTVAVNGTEIEVTVVNAVGADETLYVNYTVDTLCGDTLTGLLSVDFLA